MSSSRKSATVCNNSGNAMSPLARPGVRSSVAIVDMCLIGFMGSSNLALNLTPCMNSSQPERGLLKSANIEDTFGEGLFPQYTLLTCALNGSHSSCAQLIVMSHTFSLTRSHSTFFKLEY